MLALFVRLSFWKELHQYFFLWSDHNYNIENMYVSCGVKVDTMPKLFYLNAIVLATILFKG